jgi:hypothetical protein
VKDRLAQTYEYLFHFVKSRRYYYCLDNVREPHRTESVERWDRALMQKADSNAKLRRKLLETTGVTVASMVPKWFELSKHDIAVGRIGNVSYTDPLHAKEYHPLGKNPGDVVVPWWWGVDKHGEYRGHATKNYKSAMAQDPSEVKRNIIESFKKHPNLGKNPGDVVRSAPWLEILRERANPGDFFSIATRPYSEAHFAVFPPELPLRPILASCPPDGVVLDPLAGSGTVAFTCELINHGEWDYFRLYVNEAAKSVKWYLKWILMEINPNYCELAKKRLQPYVAQKSLLEFA